jgi:uncharacterized protein YdeI (YjbR/CyaY-like superfamily)
MDIETLYVPDRHQWRAWLAEHHQTEKEIWLILYKKHTGQPSVPYDDAVEEALCFGWIDSIVRKIDEDRYAQKYTPRKMNSLWSEPNRQRIRKLIAEGRMEEAGLAKIPPGLLDQAPRVRPDGTDIPLFVETALKADPEVWASFSKLAPSHRRNYLRWILEAKKEETRQRRLQEAVAMLKRNEKLGLK